MRTLVTVMSALLLMSATAARATAAVDGVERFRTPPTFLMMEKSVELNRLLTAFVGVYASDEALGG